MYHEMESAEPFSTLSKPRVLDKPASIIAVLIFLMFVDALSAELFKLRTTGRFSSILLSLYRFEGLLNVELRVKKEEFQRCEANFLHQFY